jgi:PAS domain S-box-containing protein
MSDQRFIDPRLVLRALGAATSDLVYVLSRDGRFTFVNEPAAQVLGLTPDAMLGRTWSELGLLPEHEIEFNAERQRVMSTGIPSKREVSFSLPGGERAFESVVTPIYDDAQTALGVVVISRDVTTRHDAEKRYRDLADAMPQIVFSARADGFTDYYNKRWYEFTGVDPAGGGDDSFLPILHPDDVERTLETWRTAVRTQQPYDIEYRFFDRATNTYRWHLGRALPVIGDDGTVLRWYGTATDIEDLKFSQSEVQLRGQALERQNFMLRTLLDVSDILSAELDTGKLLQYITDAATMLAGAEFGAYFTNEINERGESYMLWTISGVAREVFDGFPMPRNTAVFGPTFSGSGVVRSDDIRKDPRYGHNTPYHGLPEGHLPVVSYLAVPVISRSGEVLGGLFFGHSQPGKFPEEAERLVTGVAAQAAIAIDNARLLENARAAAEKLRIEEERYRTLVTATAQTVWSTDANGVPNAETDGFRTLMNITLEEARAGGGVQRVHPEHRERFLARWNEALTNGTPYDVELPIYIGDRYRWLGVRGVPVHNEDGSVREWIGTATDIDDRKRAEEASVFLADASALLTESLDPETILTRLAALAVPRLADWCAIDVAPENGPHRRVVIAHRDAEQAAMIAEIDRSYPLPAAVDPIAQVIRTGRTQYLESIHPAYIESLAQDERHLEIIRTLGLRSWIIAPIVSGGRVYGALSFVLAESGRRFESRDLPFVEDLAARVGVAVHNAALYVEAQAANKAKDEFLATLSHELRTPMTAILGWARMLEMGDLDPVLVREGIQAIARSAKTQAQLIEDILDVSRITLGKLHLKIADVDVNEIVSNAVDAVNAPAAVKSIAIDATFDTRQPHVSGDANRLQQVVWNLMNNAVKFTPNNGRVKVSVEGGETHVRIRVTDTGVGIAPEFLPHVFDRFRQADSTTTRRFGGLGLGLAIVRQITEMHRGAVDVASDGIGHGTTFTVTLPVLPEGAQANSAQSNDVMPDLHTADILVVDDDPDARRFIAAALQRAGATVREAESASAALTAIRARTPRVLVSDVAMPERDGFELLADVRNVLAIDETRMSIIAITAFGGPDDRERILAAGFQRCIVKPADPVDLARVVAEVL